MNDMREIAQRYATTIVNFCDKQDGLGSLKVSTHGFSPRFCIIKLDGVDDPDTVNRHARRLALALGKHEDEIRFGYPLNGEPRTAFLEIPYDDFVSLSLHETVEHIFSTTAVDSLLKETVIPLGIGLSPVFLDLEEDAHVIIGGSTGSGKSVLLRSMVNYILTYMFNTTLYIIDPKAVDFARYPDISQNITEGAPAKDPMIMQRITGTAAHAEVIALLEMLVNVMDQRFEIFARANAKDLTGFRFTIGPRPFFYCVESESDYNGMVSDMSAATGVDLSSKTAEPCCRSGFGRLLTDRIIVVIDEMADLLTTANKDEREQLLQLLLRLAQKGRAAGIHLIMATQRPTVNVIPGALKANVPARIALRCASATDSMTILDNPAATSLAGAGDALFSNGVMRRFQAPLPDATDDQLVESSQAVGYPLGRLAMLRRTFVVSQRVAELANATLLGSAMLKTCRERKAAACPVSV